MRRKYYNLKVVSWTFEYARNEKYSISGEIVELPVHVGDKYPHLFKPVERVVTTEKQPEVKKDEEVVTAEAEPEIQDDEEVVVEDEEEPSLLEQFKQDLENGNVSRGSKFLSWRGRRCLISAWEELGDDEDEKESFIRENFID